MSNSQDEEFQEIVQDYRPWHGSPEQLEELTQTFTKVAEELQRMLQLMAQAIAISLEPLRDLIESYNQPDTEKENQNDS